MPALILECLGANLAFFAVALTLGESVLRRLGCDRVEPGAALLAGFGACASGGLVLAALHVFYWQALAVSGVAVVVLGHRTLRRHLVWPRLSRDPVVLSAVLVAGVVAVAQWLAALAPPEATDELAYHLPEAHTLADTHSIHLMLGSDRIYGNLPALAETLYAEALTIKGAALAHLLHFSLLLSFVLLAAGVVRSLWGARPAALAAAGLLLYSDLTYNATTAYVDGAETAFEAGAVLLFARWAVTKMRGDAAAGALLLGFALAVKYNALATAVLATVLVLVIRPRWLPRLAAVAFVACGYWYMKNLVRFHNPVYPFYFGHPGITGATYRYFIGTVHAFGPRTPGAFVEVPTRFATDPNATAYLGFALAPFALAARGPRRAAGLLLAYSVAFTTYWFWFASHQTRFLLSAAAIAIVLAAVALGAARTHVALAAVLAFALLAAGGAQLKAHGFNAHLRAAVDSWLDTPKSRYALGLESRSAYLHRYFGCLVDAADTLAARGLAGGVALWDLTPSPGFPRANLFAPIKVTATTVAGVGEELRRRDVRFALAQGMPVTQLSSNPAAAPILRSATPFWRGGDCTLYRLNGP